VKSLDAKKEASDVRPARFGRWSALLSLVSVSARGSYIRRRFPAVKGRRRFAS
jgi:hypothetical protein